MLGLAAPRPLRASLRPQRPSRAVRAVRCSSDPFDKVGQAAREAKKKLEKFAEEQRLKEKLAAAGQVGGCAHGGPWSWPRVGQGSLEVAGSGPQRRQGTSACSAPPGARRLHTRSQLRARAGPRPQEASARVSAAAEELQDRVQRKAKEVDRDYGVSDKAQRAAAEARAKADEIESKYGVGRRAKALWQDVQRQWPGVSGCAVAVSAAGMGRRGSF